jgi:predicted esterase YcpF (UPF0227 family)
MRIWVRLAQTQNFFWSVRVWAVFTPCTYISRPASRPFCFNPTVDPIGDSDRREHLKNNFDEDDLAAWCNEYTEQIRGLYHTAAAVDARNLFVFLNRDDEVLDYRNAERFFRVNNCKVTIANQGGHRFEKFEELIPTIRAIYTNLP